MRSTPVIAYVNYMILLFFFISSINMVLAQSGELSYMMYSVDMSKEQREQVNFSFEIKDNVLTIYDHSSGSKVIWRYYKLLSVTEDSEDVKSYDTGSATIRIYFPEKVGDEYKGRLELNIVHDRGDYWTFINKLK